MTNSLTLPKYLAANIVIQNDFSRQSGHLLGFQNFFFRKRFDKFKRKHHLLRRGIGTLPIRFL